MKLLLAAALLSSLLQVSGCGCGFDCNNGNNDGPAILSLGLSDSIPEQLKQVVIEVDRITFRRSGAEDVVVEQFTIDTIAVDTFQVDLLQYRGRSQLQVITDLELDTGTYSEVLIGIIGNDINRSFVQEADDSLKPITVGASGLSAPGMTLSSKEQLFTVEFGLAQSLQFQSTSDNYLLASNGIRTEDNAVAASLSGRIDTGLFDSVSPCDEKTDPELGNRVYIYQGHGLSPGQPGDVFNSDSGTQVPDDAVAPFAVASMAEDSLTGNWQYSFGFLPPGDYTLTFSCDTEDDDSVDFDDLVVPFPAEQIYELSLDEAERAACDLSPAADCSGL